MSPQRFDFLFHKYQSDTISPNEWEELKTAFASGAFNDRLGQVFDRMIDGKFVDPNWSVESQSEVWEKMMATGKLDQPEVIQMQSSRRSRMFKLAKWAAAASLIIGLAGLDSYYYFNRKMVKQTLSQHNIPTDIMAPQTNRATITLADGQRLFLDSAAVGNLTSQKNVQIKKLGDGQIAYSGKTEDLVYNTLDNPRGSKTVTITLTDGTRVWLNAGSSLTYPVAFRGPERKVGITGEAYFEVVHNNKMPFRVQANGQTIEDVGTSFNVNAYVDEASVRTTLLEGSIKVLAHGSSQLVKPGQQTIVANVGGSIGLNSNVNLENVIAWKNGFFAFQDADIKAVMHQLSRWYNVDVKYEGNISKEEFNGKIGQGLTLAQVLKILEKTGVHFKIEEDKRIVILP